VGRAAWRKGAVSIDYFPDFSHRFLQIQLVRIAGDDRLESPVPAFVDVGRRLAEEFLMF
jgi:hypothetical protein